MHAASRETYDYLVKILDGIIQDAADKVAAGMNTGANIFDVVEVLDSDRSLRMTLIDDAISADKRAELISSLFQGKISQTAQDIVSAAVKSSWSNTRDFRRGLVKLGQRSLLRAAEAQGQLDQVEDELFRLARILEREPQLELLLADRTAPAARRRELLASVLYGKVTAVTEALGLNIISRPHSRPVEDFDAACATAAALKNQEVAYVRSAAPLNELQKQALEQKLEKIYGRKIAVHAEADSSLLGGAVVRVGYEVIDGSTAGQLAQLRRNFG